MTININGLQSPQSRFLTENLADESKDISIRLITGKCASAAEDPAKNSLASQMDVDQSRLKVARDSIDAGSATQALVDVLVPTLYCRVLAHLSQTQVLWTFLKICWWMELR